VRIRAIKPEFWSSEDVAALDWPTRLLFVGLWSYVDDNGVGRDVERLIVADLFPLEPDPRETLATVSRGLRTLFERGQIIRYEVDGRPYLYVAAWNRHQKIDRPNKPRYPLPTSTNANTRETLARHSRGLRQNVASGTGEQGNRGTGEQRNTTTLAIPSPSEWTPVDGGRTSPLFADDLFDQFWAAYPRRINKAAAAKAWKTAVKRAEPEEIVAAAARFRDDPNLRPEEFRPYPSTWLRADGWLNPPELPRQDASTGARGSTADRRLADALSLSQRLEAQENTHHRQPQPIGR
jgi:hypothetical protein